MYGFELQMTNDNNVVANGCRRFIKTTKKWLTLYRFLHCQ